MKEENYNLAEWKDTGTEENKRQENRGTLLLNRFKWVNEGHIMK